VAAIEVVPRPVTDRTRCCCSAVQPGVLRPKDSNAGRVRRKQDLTRVMVLIKTEVVLLSNDHATVGIVSEMLETC
jgi:hypothetical protein